MKEFLKSPKFGKTILSPKFFEDGTGSEFWKLIDFLFPYLTEVYFILGSVGEI